MSKSNGTGSIELSGMPPSPGAPAQELARQLLRPEIAMPAAPGTAVAGAERVCRRVSDELARWIGAEGCRALFSRALASAQAAGHPVLDSVRNNGRSEYYLNGLADGAARHGPEATIEGVAAVLAALIELLGRLMGDDMARSLVEQSERGRAPKGVRSRTDGAAS